MDSVMKLFPHLRRRCGLMRPGPGAQDMSRVMLPENSATKVSDHVSAIVGFPNVIIVVGNGATLVVDTGLGPKNGAIVVREVERLRKSEKLYLTTTHFHPGARRRRAGFSHAYHFDSSGRAAARNGSARTGDDQIIFRIFRAEQGTAGGREIPAARYFVRYRKDARFGRRDGGA